MKTFTFLPLLFLGLFIANNSTAQDTIHWRPNYKLKWEDFQGTPDHTSLYKAISSPAINYTLSYNEKSFSYQVVCSFNKKKSWIKAKDSLLLKHEQGHFDIAEIFAAKLRQLFENYKFNAATIQSDFKIMYDKIRKERDKMDSLYDKETNFSRNKSKQIYWIKKITQELKKLEQFKG